MKRNAEDNKPFSLNAHVRERLEMWDGSKNKRVDIVMTFTQIQDFPLYP